MVGILDFIGTKPFADNEPNDFSDLPWWRAHSASTPWTLQGQDADAAGPFLVALRKRRAKPLQDSISDTYPGLLRNPLPRIDTPRNEDAVQTGPAAQPGSVITDESEMPGSLVSPASYQDTMRPRPWWNPPGVFDPWAEQFVKGMQGLLEYRRGGSVGAGANSPRNDPDCRKEWERAYDECEKWLSMPNPPRHLIGGHQNIEDCARGHVSEECRGNPYEREPPLKKREWWSPPRK